MQDQPFKMAARKKHLLTLVQEVVTLAGLSEWLEERSSLMLLTSAFDEICGIKPSPDSIRRLLNDLQSPDAFTEKGFKQNKLKEIFAAYWLIRKGRLNKEQLQVIRAKHRGEQDKLKHIYFEQYSLISREKIKLATAPEQSAHFLGDIHELPDFFKNTYWYCYNYIQSSGAINRNVVYISNQSDGVFLKCKLFNANLAYENYEGVVCLDYSRCFLLFYMATADTRSKHLHIKFRTPQGVRPSILIGQDNIIGSQSNAINSETLILKHVEDQHGNIPEQLTCFPAEPDGSYGPEMPAAIADYLVYMREREMTSPSINFYTETALAAWVRNNQPRRMADETLLSYCHKYWIYYDYVNDEDQRVIDELELEFERLPQQQQPNARLQISTREFYEKAHVLRNNNFITAYFFHENAGMAQANCIFLQIQVGGKFIEQDMECFVATISGLSDKQESAVSYLALVIPQSISEFQRKDDPRILDFFNASPKGGIETFPPRGFKLGNLNRMRGMG